MKCSACLIVALGWSMGLLGQSSPEDRYTIDFNTYAGSILKHNPDISHLITAHPAGATLSLNRKTFGAEAWHQAYNYPDTGISLVYQDMNNETLGHHIGLYAHFNFYFFKRNVQLRLAQGIAYNTNPYDRITNFRGNAYGSHLLSTTHLMLNYQKENVIDRLGVKGGITLVHYSNANVKAPNTSTNTFAINLGLIYALSAEATPERIRLDSLPKIRENIKLNLVFRSGINESDVVNSGQFPFYIFSGYADKRLGRKSAIQLGGDVFISNFLKELIQFQAIAFPENNVNADDDFKRVGLFVGHELFINNLSIVSQFGYYVYYPFDFEGRTYNRIGLKRYFNSKWYATLTLKSHAARAEALEIGIGIRL
ncbi:MAG: acyloxyacyl hydrolase [Flavobacteriaceae bacterium]|nr:acyloxyacyl hydrolase [Flavobacteriaceae bacterium]